MRSADFFWRRTLPIALLVLFGLAVLIFSGQDDPQVLDQAAENEIVASAEVLPLVTAHVVKKGQALGTIARDWAPNGTTGLDLVALNQDILAPVFVTRCGDLSEAFRTREAIDFKRWKKGGGDFFCNEKKGNDNFPAWTNSIKPGDVIYIPSASSPDSTQVLAGQVAKDVNTAVAGMTGKSIVLVVDASGSMAEDSDRKKVTTLYGRLLGERAMAVVMFAEKAVTVSDLDAHPDLGDASVENIALALQHAASLGADQIVLIGDEPGDDLAGADFSSLPPVAAHCLPDLGSMLCEYSFADIATKSGGQLIN